MNETFSLLLTFLAGGLLGTFFFGGLWWTVRKRVSSRQQAFWFSGSLLLRMGVILGGFILVAGSDWIRFLMCLLGFIMARLVTTWLVVSRAVRHNSPRKSDNHAS